MAVPGYESMMLPLLQLALGNKGGFSKDKAAVILAKQLGLADADVRERLPNGTQSTFLNRIAWAVTYMKKAGLLETTHRGLFQITKRGKELLASQPKAVNIQLLKQYPEFLVMSRLSGLA